MKFIRENKWQVSMMTGAPKPQMIQKEIEAPSQEVAIHRAQVAYPNQQFVQVTATLMDPQTNQPSPQQTQPNQMQTTMSRMQGLHPLRGLAQPGQQQTESRRITYPYSITLPSHFSRLLRETSPVPVIGNLGQYHIVLESDSHLSGFLNRLIRHRDRESAGVILRGIRSSLS